MAERTPTLGACEAQCKNASGKCDYRVGTGKDVAELSMCFSCTRLPNGTQCDSCAGGYAECLEVWVVVALVTVGGLVGG